MQLYDAVTIPGTSRDTVTQFLTRAGRGDAGERRLGHAQMAQVVMIWTFVVVFSFQVHSRIVSEETVK